MGSKIPEAGVTRLLFFPASHILILSLFCFFVVAPYQLLAGSDTPTASKIVKNVQRIYDEMDDAVIHFSQTTMVPLSQDLEDHKRDLLCQERQ